MRRPGVWRGTVKFSVVVLALCVVARPSLLRGQTTKGKAAMSVRPGDTPYTPTKLEWAALDLQASYGTAWSREDPVAKAYVAANDGKTVRCILQYLPSIPAQDVKAAREVAQVLFDRYAAGRGWNWLRIQFEEMPLPEPH